MITFQKLLLEVSFFETVTPEEVDQLHEDLKQVQKKYPFVGLVHAQSEGAEAFYHTRKQSLISPEREEQDPLIRKGWVRGGLGLGLPWYIKASQSSEELKKEARESDPLWYTITPLSVFHTNAPLYGSDGKTFHTFQVSGVTAFFKNESIQHVPFIEEINNVLQRYPNWTWEVNRQILFIRARSHS